MTRTITSGIRTLRGAVIGSILRLSTVVLFVGLVSGPASANADDMVLKWNDLAARTAVVTSPFNQARVMAIVQLSVFEAVNAITGDYEPYLNPATAAASGASVDAAVIIAAHRALTNYFPAATFPAQNWCSTPPVTSTSAPFPMVQRRLPAWR